MGIRWKKRAMLWAVAMTALVASGQYTGSAESADPVVTLTPETTPTATPQEAGTPTPEATPEGTPEATPAPGKVKKSDMYPHKVKPFKLDKDHRSQSEPMDPDVCRSAMEAHGVKGDEKSCTHTTTITSREVPGLVAPPKPPEADQPAQTPPAPAPEKGKIKLTAASQINMLGTNESLEMGQAIYSGGGDLDKQYMLIMQTDGNLVFYSPSALFFPGRRTALWSTGTSGNCGNCIAVMQGDGNLVVYSRLCWPTLNFGVSCSLSPRWQSGTSGLPYGGRLYAQSDGNLVIYNMLNMPAWSSGTNVTGAHNLWLEVQQCDGFPGNPCAFMDTRVSAIFWFNWQAVWLENNRVICGGHAAFPWQQPNITWCNVGTWANPNPYNYYTHTMNIGANVTWCLIGPPQTSGQSPGCHGQYMRGWVDIWGRYTYEGGLTSY